MTDYEGRRPRYEDFGEYPPLTAEDVALICDELEDEHARKIMDFWYGSKQNREEQIRNYLANMWAGLN